MILTLGSAGQEVKLNRAQFNCDFNFLEDLNAKLISCFVSGTFKKEDLNFASAIGKIECEISTKCCRCGTDVNFDLNIDFNEGFCSDENENCYVLTGSQINIEQMIIDKILLSFPNNILCKKDCKGLCSVCGNNLNEEKCECLEKLDLINPANPFNVLKKLKNDRRK